MCRLGSGGDEAFHLTVDGVVGGLRFGTHGEGVGSACCSRAWVASALFTLTIVHTMLLLCYDRCGTIARLSLCYCDCDDMSFRSVGDISHSRDV